MSFPDSLHEFLARVLPAAALVAVALIIWRMAHEAPAHADRKPRPGHSAVYFPLDVWDQTAPVTVDLGHGHSVLCIAFQADRGGGISCDWGNQR